MSIMAYCNHQGLGNLIALLSGNELYFSLEINHENV